MAAGRKGTTRLGRPPSPPESVRRNRVVVLVTDGELALLRTISEAWKRPVGTVAHEILAKGLRRRPS